MRMLKSIDAGTAAGVNVTTAGTASAGAAFPVNSAGLKARYYRLTVTAAAHFKQGIGAGVTATVNDMMVVPGTEPIVAVGSNTHFSVIQDSAAGSFNVCPLDDE